MNTPSPLTPRGLLGEVNKLLRHTLNLGAEASHWLHLLRDEEALSNFVQYLKLGCPKVRTDGTIVTSRVVLAQMILGDDFITPEKVTKAFGIRYTDEQLTAFIDTLPDFETLIWLHWNGFMLVPGPNTDLNLLSVLELDRSLFYRDKKGRCWFEDATQEFSRTDMISGGQWFKLRKSYMPKSLFKSWIKQSKLVISPERIPNAAEVAYGVILYRRVHGISLMSDFHVRTSSIDKGRLHVCIGDFDRTGLDIDVNWSDGGHRNIGVASVQK